MRSPVVTAADDSTCAVTYTAAKGGSFQLQVLYGDLSVNSTTGWRLDVVEKEAVTGPLSAFVIPDQPQSVVAGSEACLAGLDLLVSPVSLVCIDDIIVSD